ncbi:MAG: malonyl-CoA synthase [Gammaproteobacteria bacterium CG11_big_fil_rev_8_21_14_0_20_46_22]|nr:MAG: malonyl-CoA synthase [Gammaproteobacteria bacterium CG11_big_fil_rev_8_21_14_0_20_46_22]
MNANLYSHFMFDTKKQNPLILLDDGKIFTYEDVDQKVAQYCNFFSSIELQLGDRIVQQTEKCLDALCVYLASLRFGAIYIPLNPSFQSEELTYFIEDAEPSLFVCSLEKEKTVVELIRAKGIPLILETLAENGSGSIQKKVSNFGIHFDTVEQCENDIACILYTSGTTGQPKGAMLSHKNLLANGRALKDCWGFTESDTLLHMLPIFHCHGLFFSCHCVLLSGASTIFLPKLDIDLAIKHLPNSTVLMGVPTYYTRLLGDGRFTPTLTKNVRLFISGSAPLLEKTFYEFEEKFGQRILERYGMTETGINTSNALHGDRIPGSVGLPLPITQLRIVDDEDNETKGNDAGHIQVKGDNVFGGYWKKEDKIKESFTQDGYFRTGDVGTKANNDYISIVGRAKDMIITGGINVYPKEIETLINKMDGVKESAVVGLPHSDFGEAVTAMIVLKPGSTVQASDVISSIKKSLANYKVPKKVLFIDDLPRNAMGKIQKNVLRSQYNDLFS